MAQSLVADVFGLPVDERVQRLQVINAQQPLQRSDAWHEERRKRMTASSIAAVLKLKQIEINLRDQGVIELEASKRVGQVMPAFNTFAKELRIKCGLEPSGGASVFTEWGVIYEPVVKELYQYFHQIQVHEFGLIPHPRYDWLGASPDGVTSAGRMIEIKCPYSRQPSGLPKLQYWVQMQIQMECCGFEECDFLEIVVREYTDRESYLVDQYPGVYCRTQKGLPKGIVIEYTDDERSGLVGNELPAHREYFYPPVMTFANEEQENQWVRDWCNFNCSNSSSATATSPARAMLFNGERMAEHLLYQRHQYRVRYWRLEEWHSRLVTKNEDWLRQRLPDVHEFWKLVLQYRQNGVPDKFKLRDEVDDATNAPSSFATNKKERASLAVPPSEVCMFYDSDGDEE
jgi:hypothetical protein